MQKSSLAMGGMGVTDREGLLRFFFFLGGSTTLRLGSTVGTVGRDVLFALLSFGFNGC